MAECIHCRRSWTGFKPEHCPVCHETFTGTEAGDMHRVGGWDPGDEPRRCLSPEEMRGRMVRGVSRPLVQDARGLWKVDRPPRAASTWSVSEQHSPSHPHPGTPGPPDCSGP